MSYKVKLIKSISELEGIKEIWQELYSLNNFLSPYQSFEWNFILVKNKWYKGKLHIYILYRDDYPILIAPLIKRNFFGIYLWEFLGSETHADYLDFIYDNRLNENELKFFVNLLMHRYPYTVFKLGQINEISRTWKFLLNYSLLREKYTTNCVYIPILSTNEEYYNSLGKSTKKQIKNFINRLKKGYGKDVEFYFDVKNQLSPIEIEESLDLYKKRKESKSMLISSKALKTISDVFISPHMPFNFYLSQLYLMKKLVAVNVGIISKNTNIAYNLILAFDLLYQNLSVGNVLLFLLVNEFIKRKDDLNINYLDLTRGTELYKIKYGGKIHKNHCFVISYSFIPYIYFKLFKELKLKTIKILPHSFINFLIKVKYRL